jgi:hypothetical protein
MTSWYSDLSVHDISINLSNIYGNEECDVYETIDKLSMFDDNMYSYVCGLRYSSTREYVVSCCNGTTQIIAAYSAIHAVFLYMVSARVLYPLNYEIHKGMTTQEISYIMRKCYELLKTNKYIQKIKELR